MAIHNNREGRELLERGNVAGNDGFVLNPSGPKSAVFVFPTAVLSRFDYQQFRNLLRIALFISLHTGKCSGGGLRN